MSLKDNLSSNKLLLFVAKLLCDGVDSETNLLAIHTSGISEDSEGSSF